MGIGRILLTGPTLMIRLGTRIGPTAATIRIMAIGQIARIGRTIPNFCTGRRTGCGQSPMKLKK